MIFETPLPRILRIEVPLPKNPLRALNSYLIMPHTADERALLIDTGFNHPQTLAALEEALHQLNIDLTKLDLLATHLHSDHSGLLAYFKNDSNQLFASTIDGGLINEMTTEDYWQRFQNLYTIVGLDVDGITYKDHPGYTYCPKEIISLIDLEEGHQLSYGGYTFEVISTKGHTPGHIVLFDKNSGCLISGDHILDQITPNISYWGDHYGDSLAAFLANLDKIATLEVKVVLPSHRNIFTDPQRRISELKQHHEHRLDECLHILNQKKTPLSARDVAKDLHWDIKLKTFDEFPSPQKWFATAEAMAHLIYLVGIGKLREERINSVAYFSLIGH